RPTEKSRFPVPRELSCRPHVPPLQFSTSVIAACLQPVRTDRDPYRGLREETSAVRGRISLWTGARDRRWGLPRSGGGFKDRYRGLREETIAVRPLLPDLKPSVVLRLGRQRLRDVPFDHDRGIDDVGRARAGDGLRDRGGAGLTRRRPGGPRRV